MFGDLEDFFSGKYAEYDRKILQVYLAEGKMPPQTDIDFGNEMADQFSLYRDLSNASKSGKIENPQGYRGSYENQSPNRRGDKHFN